MPDFDAKMEISSRLATTYTQNLQEKYKMTLRTTPVIQVFMSLKIWRNIWHHIGPKIHIIRNIDENIEFTVFQLHKT